jgi:hypothetical protein
MTRRLLAGAIVAGSLALAVPAHAITCPPAWGPRSIDLGLAAVTYCWPITPDI